MTEKLYIKGNLSSDAREYIFDNKQITALNSEWRRLGAEEALLDELPQIDERYDITLNGPLKMDLSQPFWLVYMNPYSTYNGLEDEEGINSFRFCLCEYQAIIARHERSLCLKVKVLDVYDLQKHVGFMNPKGAGLFMLLRDTDPNDRHEASFTNYYFISINIHSNLGLTVIIKKEQDKSYIIAINEWDSHKDIWHLYYEELTPDKKQEYKITHL